MKMNSVKSMCIVFCFTFFLIYHHFIAFDLSFAERLGAESGNAAIQVKTDEIQQGIDWTNEKIRMIQAVKPEQLAAQFDVQVTDIEKSCSISGSQIIISEVARFDLSPCQIGRRQTLH